ncbi:ankyrin repeat domain-containing protein [Streptomyces sp. NPDC056661]|uniref:ankyrin repeat domain-containing protein n=1 Tax=Streptomyces sp. NPDC056661 TaxID=3345898 RepID=UPI003685C1B9
MLPLGCGSESVDALLLDVPDEHGEYPVITIWKDPNTYIVVSEAGFDTWLARVTRLIPDTRSVYAESVRAAEHRVLGETSDENWLFCDGLGDEDEEAQWAVDVAADTAARDGVRGSVGDYSLPEGVSVDRLSKIISQAMQGRDLGKVEFMIGQAEMRFPNDRAWADAALTAWWDWHGLELLDRVLAAGADPDLKMHHAAINGEVEALARLLDAGGHVDQERAHLGTPLHRAADNHQLDCVRLLLDRGAAVDTPGRSQQTALAEALHHPHDLEVDSRWRERLRDVVAVLLARGASPDPVGPVYQSSPLHEAAGLDLGVLQQLIDHGADLGARNWRGDTAIQDAWRDRNWDAFDLLRAAGSPLDTVNDAGWSLVQAASPDGRAPHTLAIELADQPGKVDYQVTAQLIQTHDTGSAGEGPINRALQLLENLNAAGAAGLGHHPPGTSSIQVLGPGLRFNSISQPKEVHHVQAVYRTRNLSPEVFGLWVHMLYRMPGMRLATLDIHPTTPRCRTTRFDVSEWLHTLPAAAIRTPDPMPFPVHDRSASKRLCVITAHPDQHEAIAATLAAIGDITEGVTPLAPHPELRVLTWLAKRHGEHLMFPLLLSAREPVPGEEVHLLRTLTLLALSALQHQQERQVIRAVEWSLGNPEKPPSVFDEADFHDANLTTGEPFGDDDIPF